MTQPGAARFAQLELGRSIMTPQTKRMWGIVSNLQCRDGGGIRGHSLLWEESGHSPMAALESRTTGYRVVPTGTQPC